MTKSTITRERLAKIKSWRETYGAGSNVMLPAEEAEELARMALAAMDSEPAIADCDPEVYEKGVSVCLVAIPKETAEIICQNITAATGCKVDWHYFGGRVHIKALRVAQQPAPVEDSESWCLPLDYLQGHKDGLEWASQLAEANHPETGDWLYDDPIELAKAIRKGPDMPPSQTALDSEPVAYISKSDFDAGYPHILARRDFNKACTMPVYAAQPAPVVPVVPVVPDEIKHRIGGLDWGWEGEFNRGWNACRAAMLQELKKSAGTEAICRSDENVQVLHTNSPVITDEGALPS
ncbi:hypothetical protein OW909_24265 [Klebsiella pneumoniae]